MMITTKKLVRHDTERYGTRHLPSYRLNGMHLNSQKYTLPYFLPYIPQRDR